MPHVKKQLKLIRDCFYPTIWWSVWAGYYDYAQYIGVKFPKKEYDLFVNFVEQIHFIIPFDGICFISEKPNRIQWNNQKQLHADGRKAIEYSDGFGWHSLNNVRVPDYLAETPAGNLDIEFWKKETNADIKAEFIKKYGIDRMDKFGTIIDSYKNYKNLNQLWIDSEYELIDMSPIHEGMDYAPYLKMKNLSVPGTYHLEGVSESCKTLTEAIKDRWEENPEEYESIAIK